MAVDKQLVSALPPPSGLERITYCRTHLKHTTRENYHTTSYYIPGARVIDLVKVKDFIYYVRYNTTVDKLN